MYAPYRLQNGRTGFDEIYRRSSIYISDGDFVKFGTDSDNIVFIFIF